MQKHYFNFPTPTPLLWVTDMPLSSPLPAVGEGQGEGD